MNLPVRSTLDVPALCQEFGLHAEISTNRFQVELHESYQHWLLGETHTFATGWNLHVHPVAKAMDQEEEGK